MIAFVATLLSEVPTNATQKIAIVDDKTFPRTDNRQVATEGNY